MYAQKNEIVHTFWPQFAHINTHTIHTSQRTHQSYSTQKTTVTQKPCATVSPEPHLRFFMFREYKLHHYITWEGKPSLHRALQISKCLPSPQPRWNGYEKAISGSIFFSSIRPKPPLLRVYHVSYPILNSIQAHQAYVPSICFHGYPPPAPPLN